MVYTYTSRGLHEVCKIEEKMYKLGEKTYSTKAEAQQEAKRILNAAAIDTPLPEHEKQFMLDWFLLVHEDPARKFGVGVKSVFVRLNYQHAKRGIRGFWLARRDGSETDISYLPKKTQYAKVMSALRTAVQPTIDAYRDKHQLPASMHVDHAGDWPFSKIVTEFERQIGRKIDTLKVKPHGDGDLTEELEDKQIAYRFRHFHDSVAYLEHIPAEENIRKGNRGTLISATLTTRFGPNWTGTGVVVAHDTVTGLYQTSSGLWWKLVNGELVTP